MMKKVKLETQELRNEQSFFLEIATVGRKGERGETLIFFFFFKEKQISYFAQRALDKFHENFRSVLSGFSFPNHTYIHM